MEFDTEPPVVGDCQVHSVADVCSRSFSIERANFSEPSEDAVRHALYVYWRSTASQRVHLLNFGWHKRPGLSSGVRKLMHRNEQLRRNRDKMRYRRAVRRARTLDAGPGPDDVLISENDLVPFALEDDHGFADFVEDGCEAMKGIETDDDSHSTTVPRASQGNTDSELDPHSLDLRRRRRPRSDEFGSTV